MVVYACVLILFSAFDRSLQNNNVKDNILPAHSNENEIRRTFFYFFFSSNFDVGHILS